MARPKSEKETVLVTLRFEKEMIDQIDHIAEAIFAGRATVTKECLRLGMETLANKRPELMKAVEEYQRRKKKS